MRPDDFLIEAEVRINFKEPLKIFTMQKIFYLKELSITATQKKDGANNNKKDVMKIQSWLSLFSLWNQNAGTVADIDGDFGAATEKAVMNFQKAKGLTQNGIVDAETINA